MSSVLNVLGENRGSDPPRWMESIAWRRTLSKLRTTFMSSEDDQQEFPRSAESRLPIQDPEPTPEDQASRVDDLIDLIKETADKLSRDKASRGDVKILSRALRELRYAFKVFQQHRRQKKVTVFGSARTKPHELAYQQAVKLGKAMANAGWMVVTGAASGIMEAGHEGAGREHSMGINIMLPFEQSANPIINNDPKLVHMKYFFTRKLMFVKECDGVVCLPGGFGTLDEALEVLTLLQTGKRDMVPVVLLDAPGGGYWKSFHQYVIDHLLAAKLISPEDLSLYLVTDNVEAAVKEVTGFFHVYHSMRYVKNRLVFRLKQELSADKLAGIQKDFADILVEGTFEQRGPHSIEKDEPELASLSRLSFCFNRRNLGRLRQLIDTINKP